MECELIEFCCGSTSSCTFLCLTVCLCSIWHKCWLRIVCLPGIPVRCSEWDLYWLESSWYFPICAFQSKISSCCLKSVHLIKGQSVHRHFHALECSSITDALKTLWNQMDSLKRLIVHDLMCVRQASESRQSKMFYIQKVSHNHE